MRIVFFGNADFGCNVIDGLVSSKHDIVGVVTNKDKKSGRNLRLSQTPIKKKALSLGLNLIEQDDLKESMFIKQLKEISADLFIVIAYKILPKEIYQIPAFGSINLHASLLPAYKGAAPIQRAIINNESYTGLSSFFLNESIDGGELIFQSKVDIDKNDTFKEVWTKLYIDSSDFILETLELIENKEKRLIKGCPLIESYASKIKKTELKIDWNEKNTLVHNKIRAFSPYPSMYTVFNGKRLKILKSRIISDNINSRISGEVFAENSRLLVKCGVGALEILSLQPDSKRKMNAIDFINGSILSNSEKTIAFE